MTEIIEISLDGAASLEIPDFQRGVKPHHPIRGKYNEKLEGTGHVVVFGGVFYILDGLQRVTYKKKAIEAGDTSLSPFLSFVVLRDITWEEAAQVFIDLNQNRAKITAYDLYKAGIIAKRPEYLTLQSLAAEAGLEVSSGTRQDGSGLTAIKPLITAILQGREEHVRETLIVLTTAFPYASIFARVATGYLEYLAKAGERSPKVADQEYVVRKLQTKFKSMAGLQTAGVQKVADGKVGNESRGVAMALKEVLGTTRATRG